MNDTLLRHKLFYLHYISILQNTRLNLLQIGMVNIGLYSIGCIVAFFFIVVVFNAAT